MKRARSGGDGVTTPMLLSRVALGRGPLPAARAPPARRLATGLASLLRVTDEVAAALAQGRPVVALESTIVSHGMAWPRNMECALGVEAAVRAHGAVPATIAISEGRVDVGLSRQQLETLARAGPAAVRKVSRRDFASSLAAGTLGATTVAGTMIAAHAAGIHVFATGGIGGVHRDGHITMDVSADLSELGRTPVAVVCAGVKSILDIARTLEVLETLGVPVLTLGSDEFPAFYSAASGVRAPECVDSPRAVAEMLAISLRLGLTNGTVVAVPNPVPAEAAVVQTAVQTALEEAAARGLGGWRVTPFLLERVAQLTGGESLRANVGLVTHNAGVAAQIAGHLAAARLPASAAAGLLAAGHAPPTALPALGASGPVRRMSSSSSSSSRRSVGGGGGMRSSLGGGSGGGAPATAAGTVVGSLGGTRRLGSSAGASSGGGGGPGDELPPLTEEQDEQLLEMLSEHFSSSGFVPQALAPNPHHPGLPMQAQPVPRRRPVVVGGAVVDLICRPHSGLVLRASNPGSVRQCAGGVGRNVAEVLARLSAAAPAGGGGAGAEAQAGGGGGGSSDVVLFTAVGPEPHGDALLRHCAAVGLHVVNVVVAGAPGGGAPAAAGGGGSGAGARTATYGALLDANGSLVGAVADMDAFDAITPGALGLSPTGGAVAGGAASSSSLPLLEALLQQQQPAAAGCAGAGGLPPLLVIDGNVPAATTAAIATAAAAVCESPGHTSATGPAVLLEPVSVAKCVRALDSLHLATVIKPNAHEVKALAAAWRARMGLVSPAVDADDNSSSSGSGGGSASGGRGSGSGGGAKRGSSGRDAADGGGRGSTLTQVVTIGSSEEDTSSEGRLLGRETRALPPPRDGGGAGSREGGSVTFSAYEPPKGSSTPSGGGDDEEDDDDPDSSLDYTLLTAAQTVLAAMVRPNGISAPVSPKALLMAERSLQQASETHLSGKGAGGVATDGLSEAPAAAPPTTKDAAAADNDEPELTFESALERAAALQARSRSSLPAPSTSSSGTRGGKPQGAAAAASPAAAIAAAAAHPPALTSARGPGATIDGRKHVLVSLGKTGVMWLSAPPAADHATADLLAALPFFMACQHPQLAVDFKLCPAPKLAAAGSGGADAIVKVTGAGDTFVGALAWALSRGESMPRAIELGLAGARIAMTSDFGAHDASTVSPRLTAANVVATADKFVQAVDPEYA